MVFGLAHNYEIKAHNYCKLVISAKKFILINFNFMKAKHITYIKKIAFGTLFFITEINLAAIEHVY